MDQHSKENSKMDKDEKMQLIRELKSQHSKENSKSQGTPHRPPPPCPAPQHSKENSKSSTFSTDSRIFLPISNIQKKIARKIFALAICRLGVEHCFQHSKENSKLHFDIPPYKQLPLELQHSKENSKIIAPIIHIVLNPCWPPTFKRKQQVIAHDIAWNLTVYERVPTFKRKQQDSSTVCSLTSANSSMLTNIQKKIAR